MASRKTVPGKTPPSSSGKSPSIQQHTPPPDTYGKISPCPHLKSVLASLARDNVYVTYRQAVNIANSVSDPANASKVYTLKKDASVVSTQELVSRKLKALKCTDCQVNDFYHNFICLQCPHVGCYNSLNHAYGHYKLNQHLFGIDSHNGLLFCFLCGDYINTPALDRIRLEIMGSKKFLPEETDTTSENYMEPSKAATTGLKGFVNLGSTCFMSCILQTLIHNPIVKYQFFNNDTHFFNCDSNLDYSLGFDAVDETNACVTCSIDYVFKEFYTSNSTDGYGMTNLLMTAWYKKKSLAGFQEQDAHEFWQFLLNEFHLDYERVTQTPKGPAEDCKCITHSTFSGELQSSITCLNCHRVTETIDPLIDLSLEIGHLKKAGTKHPTLYDCLDLFTKDEKLDVMYTCQYCSTKSRATKSLKIKRFSPVVAIQLKRFEHNLANDTLSKIETAVKTPLFLNLTKYSADYDPKHDIAGDKVFELFAVVSHIGSVNTGHYIVLIKNGNGQWFKFDDSVISLVTQEEVTNTTAYLLFYITHRI